MRMLASLLGLALLTATAAQAGAWHTYTGAGGRWSIQYPDGWRVDTSHAYTALGPDKDISGVAFIVPARFTQGTNLGADSYFAVETLPSASPCGASSFLGDATGEPHMTKDSQGVTWSVESGNDAGAGNFYEETVEAAVYSHPCTATRAFLHSTNIANYTPGTVKPFDRAALDSTMEEMQASFRFAR